MKRALSAITAGFALLALVCVIGATAHAQPQPSYFAQPTAIASAVAASGAASAVKGLNVAKTYQVTSSTTAGTGTLVVTVQGSNDKLAWDTVGTVTLSLSTTLTSLSFTSNDRYVWVRSNASTLTGTGAKYSATMGY